MGFPWLSVWAGLQATRHDLFHDFIAAAINSGHTGIDPGAANATIGHEASAPMHLQQYIEQLVLHFRGVEFGHGGPLGIEFTAQVTCEAIVHKWMLRRGWR